jgi:hypothetical protein
MSVFRSRRSPLRKAIAVLTAGMIINPGFASSAHYRTPMSIVPVPQLSSLE